MSAPARPPTHVVVAGVQKAGTTAWFEYLAQHPDVWPSHVRETHAFKDHGLTADAYDQLFRGAPEGAVRLESTPSYVAGGRAVAERIAGLLPAPAVVVSLRDPVARLVSHYRMKVRTDGWETPPPFDVFVADLLAGRGDEKTRNMVRNGRYAELLAPWFEVFDDRLRVVTLDALRDDASAAVSGLVSWLALDTGPVAAFDLGARNTGGVARRPWLAKAGQQVSRRLAGVYQRHPRVRGTMRRLHDRVNGARADDLVVTAEARAALAEHYAPSLAELADLLTARDQDVPQWARAVDAEVGR